MIRVLIADDSTLTHAVLRDLLSQAPEVEIVGEAFDGRAAVEATARLRPDIVIMDVQMPIMGGLEAVAEIMARTPTPVLMLSANTDPQDSRSAFAAIELGALDVMAKPSGVATEAFAQIADRLIARVKTLSRIRVIHHYRPLRSQPPAPGSALPSASRRILAIGASTGGPKAVLQLLRGLPKGLPATILIVQHIADGFAPGFADWLNRESMLPVRLARDGDPLQPGTALVAPNNQHLTVQGNRVNLQESAPLHNCRPSVDAMLLSLARQGHSSATVAVLLTGMGSDGAAGMVELHRQGAFTIAQDEGSSVIFGMPRVAIERGGVTQVLPLEEIAGIVGRLIAD